ncbi:hypothetical protein BJY52DRAFT_661596 [Lactarius psammicola]|nr:hypothetical protein BJY52DRAFT_661596 [Lactarius psammicola]
MTPEAGENRLYHIEQYGGMTEQLLGIISVNNWTSLAEVRRPTSSVSYIIVTMHSRPLASLRRQLREKRPPIFRKRPACTRTISNECAQRRARAGPRHLPCQTGGQGVHQRSGVTERGPTRHYIAFQYLAICLPSSPVVHKHTDHRNCITPPRRSPLRSQVRQISHSHSCAATGARYEKRAAFLQQGCDQRATSEGVRQVGQRGDREVLEQRSYSRDVFMRAIVF